MNVENNVCCLCSTYCQLQSSLFNCLLSSFIPIYRGSLSLSLCPYLLYPLTHSRVNERMNVSHIESFVLILTYSLARDNSTANRSQRRRTLLSPSISFHFEPILSTGSRAGLTTFCQG